ncbi:hypothetical protein GON09_000091 [Rhodococcus sp. B50]|nr:hypothetical protein [Rhodococcus sp. B50]
MSLPTLEPGVSQRHPSLPRKGDLPDAQHPTTREAGGGVLHGRALVEDEEAYLAFSSTSTRRQRFDADSGRVSIS